MLIRLFNPNDLIGCGGDIGQSDSLGLHGSTQVYTGGLGRGLCGGLCGFYAGLCGGLF